MLDALLNPTAAAYTGRVNESQRLAGPYELRIETIPGRSRHVADDRAFLAHQGIDEATLADVRAADNSNLRPFALVFLFMLGKVLDDPIEQVARADTVVGRDRDRVAKTELVEVDGEVTPCQI